MKKVPLITSLLILIILIFFGFNWLFLPNHGRARTTSNETSCVYKLRLIDNAKQAWAFENKKATNATPTEKDLLPYLGRGIPQFPVCPAGGKYTINTLSNAPTCTIVSHILP
jgi:hypothetical protein